MSSMRSMNLKSLIEIVLSIIKDWKNSLKTVKPKTI